VTHVLALPEGAETKRFSKRIVVLEQPTIAAKLEEMAAASGHSVGAEVRGAIRWWIQSVEANR
jgi:hypothetical protein